MKIVEVSNQDLECAKQLQDVLKGAKLELPITQMVAVARVLEWYRGLCIELGRGYQVPKEVESGLKVKEFNPGIMPEAPKPKGRLKGKTK